MTFPALRRRLFFTVSALLISAAALGCWPLHALLIQDKEKACPVFVSLIRPGDRLSVGFIHSVEGCRVWDHLQIDSRYGMVVVATEFAESRTGLPYRAFDGEIFERRENHFRISNMHRPVPEIYQWVDSRYDNRLRIDGKQEIALANLAGNRLLHIRTIRLTALEWAWLKAKLYRRHRSF